MSDVQGQFKAHQAWASLLALLVAQMAGVDVQPLSDKDFNGNGEIIMTPPSVRVFYAGSDAASTSDSQRLNYELVHRVLVICADQDFTSPAAQAMASAQLASAALTLLAGTRLVLADGDWSEPLTLTSIEPQPVAGLGVGYALGIEVPGLAQFPGPNAWPTQGGN